MSAQRDPGRGGLSITLRRSGGMLPGQVLQASLQEAELEAAEGERLRELTDAVDLPALAARSPITGPGADMYQYDLVVEDGGLQNHVVIRGSHVPQELRALVALLERHA